jgi:polysaccharide chain length determinant protein (PEP-CTERM system associated)
MTYALIAPRLYEAETMILVQPQSVPEAFVQSIVSEAIDERLRTIGQQVTSRTNLENITKELRLFSESSRGNSVGDEEIELLRKRIKIDVSRGDRTRARVSGAATFTITFTWEDARKAMQVANTLASTFISENLKVRETQALGTSSFLADEVGGLEKKLKEKEDELKSYRERYMGGLPSQLDTNLRMLERLQIQLDQVNNHLREREERKITLERDVQAPQTSLPAPVPGQPVRPGEGARDLPSMKAELASLEAKYTPNHPDVVRLRTMIENMEKKEAERSSESKEGASPVVVTAANRAQLEQLRNVENEMRNLRSEVERTKAQIKMYERWVEETPKREQELLSLNRDYERLKEAYNSLLRRKLDAEIAVSMEKKQKGEQFRVIDPAKVPTKPVKPDIGRVFMLTLALGLGLGGGLGYVREMMDTSFRSPEDIEKELKLPILVSIPFRHTEQEIKARKRNEMLKAAGVAAGFAVSVVAIVAGTKGFGATIRYIKELAGL